jgi:hypothetical protein
MPISDEDRANLDKAFGQVKEVMREIADRMITGQTHARMAAALFRLEESRFHLEKYLTRYDESYSPPVRPL